MLRVEEIRVLIQENVILREVSLEVGPGERVAVLGANGAGKSTLIRTILGLASPIKGRILLNGTEIQCMACHQIARAGVACVPEGRRVFTDMSVLENLRMGAYIPGARALMDRSLDEILELFPGLAKRMNQRAGTLSGGEQQMLSIGRALMSRPRMLLIDELSLGLAPVVVQGLYRTLDQLGSDITLLLVEQNVEQALKHSNKAYILETGKVVKWGYSKDLLQDTGIREAYLGL
ncbi:MAG TPA: ABC transporter ATP-binding protein [Desulfobacteraceae bacterium]|nr:ABC transporter ATP-binding protein [Desulfobacteraceae bacterium]